MKINEVAKLTGVTVRTLHYYDEIGLLPPSTIAESGYRLYDDTALMKLQQILFYRELDFSLNQIKEIMNVREYDIDQALRHQRVLLSKKQDRLKRLIGLIDKKLEGDDTMSFKEFDMSEIEAAKKKYSDEVRERWGKEDAYKESQRKTESYQEEDWEIIMNEMNGILKEFSKHMEKQPEDPEVQNLVKQWQEHITKRYYQCTDEILAGLGTMYMCDERFRESIDRFGEGLAEFISKAIEVYCYQQ